MEERRIYCLVPFELADRLHEPLRRHFADDPTIDVVVEQRRRERRSGDERRTAEPQRPVDRERRQIRNPTGRRIGERRAPQVALSTEQSPLLPRRARRHPESIVFVERVAPSPEHAEDLDTGRLVTRIQAGETRLFSELYLRYFDRVYGYLRVALNDRHEAEDVTQQVFVDVLEAIPRYERRRQPFRAWLFSIARNRGVDNLRRRDRLRVAEPDELEAHREQVDESDANELETLRWIVDRDLLMLIERLPLAQRQVLVLVEMFGMPITEVAEILDRKPADIRVLKSRGLRFLRKRLIALDRRPERRGKSRAIMCNRQATVLRRRRFALLSR